MKSARKKTTAAKLRSWRASLIRKRAEHLGTVKARDQKSAEAAAFKTFDLDDDQRKRLVVQEQN